jgi:hypothetical protein
VKYSVIKYSRPYFDQWNDFIGKSKNGTFLFHRNFMDYHSDRFEDFSLLVLEGEKIVTVLPANRVGKELHSHQGLTYGGFICTEKIRQAPMIAIIKQVLQFLHENKIEKVHIKEVPQIYHKLPSQEPEYALFLAGAALTRRDTLSVRDASSQIKVSANRMEGVKKGIANAFEVKEKHDFSEFWNTVLIPNLRKRHNASPVHNLEEIMRLKQLFPKNIRLFVVEHQGRIAAGTVLFETDTVIHAQYISSTEDKNELGSLDFLYHQLITDVFAAKKYFDFGISNEQQGSKLNEGLIFWKESFGARTIVQDFYTVATENYKLLDNVLI